MGLKFATGVRRLRCDAVGGHPTGPKGRRVETMPDAMRGLAERRPWSSALEWRDNAGFRNRKRRTWSVGRRGAKQKGWARSADQARRFARSRQWEERDCRIRGRRGRPMEAPRSCQALGRGPGGDHERSAVLEAQGLQSPMEATEDQIEVCRGAHFKLEVIVVIVWAATGDDQVFVADHHA